MSEAQPEIGTQFGPYLLKRKLGSGGMGTVYEAQDTVMDRTVALKLISGPYAQDPNYRQRLQREARIAGRLQDPHVVPVHSTGDIDGQLYVDMRLINGTDLETLLQRSGPLAPTTAVAVVRQIASALDAAHSVGVLHRDVKPGNIIITADDFAYLVDFGIANAATEAKVTQMGDVLGTWTYMAPERFRGDESQVTSRADTYALACVLVEALTGAPPFAGDTASLVGKHLSEPPPRISSQLGLPPALDDVIARGLAKDPEERYTTSGDFARAAEAALTNLGSATASFTIPAAPIPTVPGQTPQHTPPPPQHTPPPQQAPYPGPQHPPQQHWPQPGGQFGPPGAGPPTGQNWGPPSAPSKRNRWILIAAAILLVVVVAAAVGIWQFTKPESAATSTAKKAPDTSKLDVGRYGTKPRPLTGVSTQEEGRIIEAYRLAEGVTDPYAVDPVMDHAYGYAAATAEKAAATISGTGTPLTQPVLEKYGMVSAYIVQGFSKRINDFMRDKEGDMEIIMLTSFPNDDAAARAATEMDSVDFAVNPDNRTVPIPGYPQAKAHYRPDSPSVGSTMASGRLVMSVAVRSDANPNLPYLTQRIQHTFDVQRPLVEKLIPGTTIGLTGLPLDPDNMLSRLFLAGEQPKVSDSFGSMGPRAAVICADSQARKDQLFQQAGIDRCAFSMDSSLLRAKDEAAATALLPKLVEAARPEFIDHDVPPPDGVPGARCYERKPETVVDNANGRFECVVAYGRYNAGVWSNEEKDVRQRAAAQYAILVNSA